MAELWELVRIITEFNDEEIFKTKETVRMFHRKEDAEFFKYNYTKDYDNKSPIPLERKIIKYQVRKC